MTLRILLLGGLALVLGCDAERGEAPAGAADGGGDSTVAPLPSAAPTADSMSRPGTDTGSVPAVQATVGDEAPAAGTGASAAPPPPPAAGGVAAGPLPAEDRAGARGDVTDDEASAVLRRAERAYEAVRSMRASFVQDLTVPLLASSQRSRGEIFHRKPDRFLMRFSDPAGDVVVVDGRNVWLYYPSSDPKQVIRTSMGQAGRLDLQREFLSDPTGRFNATLDGSENVDGRPATALTLVPRGDSPYRRVRIWVDARDALVRRFEITESNDAVRRIELHDLRTNMSLADSLFSFTPPPGTQVFDQ